MDTEKIEMIYNVYILIMVTHMYPLHSKKEVSDTVAHKEPIELYTEIIS